MNLLATKKTNRKKQKKTAFRFVSFLLFAVFVFNISFSHTYLENNSLHTPKTIHFTGNQAFAGAGDAYEYSWSGAIDYILNESLLGTSWNAIGKPMLFSIGDTTAKGILIAVDALLYIIVWLLSKTLLFSAFLMNMSMDPAFIDRALMGNKGIYLGWGLVRDFVNLLFMMALLFSAFATIFQVEKYHLKKIIVLLVVMALLVNFSYPISLFIIDFSNSAMFFIHDAAFTGGASEGVANLTSIGLSFETLLSIETGMEKTAMLFFSIIFLFILGTTLSAFGASLVIRLLALSLLITFSPVGFAFMFFPPTKSIADSWWENIIKYSLMGPILMLTLLITVLIFHGSTDIVISKDTDSQSLLGSFVSFFVPIAALWMGLIASQKFGAAASGMAMNFAKKTGSTLAKGGAHWVDRTLAASKYGKYFSPMAWKAGWKSRQTRLDQEAIAKSSGAIENVLEGAISRASVLNPIYGIRRLREGFRAEGMDKLIEDRKTKTAASYDAKIAAATQPGDKAILKGQKQKALKEFDDPGLMMRAALRSDSILKKLVLSPSDMDRTDRDFISKTNQANTEEKKIAEVSTNSGYALDELKTAIAQKDSNKVHGAILRLTKENDLNDLMMSDLGMAFGSDGKVDSEKLPEVLAKMYDAAGITNKEHIARNLMRIGEIGASNGNFGYYDMGKYDEKQGKFVTSAFKDRANNVVGKFRNFEPQTRQKVIHPDGMFVYSSNEDAVFSQMGMNILNEAITGDDLEQINRTRGDVKTKLHAFVKTVDSYSGTTSNPAAFKAKYEEVAKENITKKLNKQGLDENKDPAAFKKEFDKEFQKATSQTEIDKEMTRAKKAIEQYGQLNNIAKTYVRMGYHMEAGLEKKDAKDKAIKTVEQESPSPTP